MAGTLANRGKMVVPRLVLRVQDANGSWQEQISAGEPRDVLPPSNARALLAAWQHYGEKVAAHWGMAIAGEGRLPHTWFIGVAPTTGETRYAIAILIEHATDPQAAVRIGTALLEAAAAR
jgi:cell division protein FtsI/penicillin-binding protein 2